MGRKFFLCPAQKSYDPVGTGKNKKEEISDERKIAENQRRSHCKDQRIEKSGSAE
jgi:hypothetical protein